MPDFCHWYMRGSFNLSAAKWLMLCDRSSLSAVRERRIEYELSYDRPTGAGAALPPFKNTLGFGVPRKVARLCGERRRNEVGGFWDILSQRSIAEFVPTSTEVISRRPAPGKSAGLFASPMDNRESYDFVLHL